MKYYAVKYKYLHMTSNKGNLGDNMQSLAVVDVLQALGIDEADIDFINRDAMSLGDRNRPEGIFIVQGWFGCVGGQNIFPVNDDNIRLLYFGFHLNQGSWLVLGKDKAFIASMKKYEPIGCRDFGTMDFLRSLGVKAYFSGCMTIMFEERKESVVGGKVFLVDNIKALDQFLPEDMQFNAVRLSQEDYSPSGYSPSGEWPMTDDDVLKVDQVAAGRLARIKAEASQVITGRIHIAMPSAAMGIPTVFCTSNPDDPRITVVKRILPVYSEKDLGGIVWDELKKVDISKEKERMRLLFSYRLQSIENQLGLNSERLSGDESEKAKNLLESACSSRAESIPYKTTSYNKEDILKLAFGKMVGEVLCGQLPVVLFGAGSAGGITYSILRYCGVEPACFCDNNKSENDFADGVPVIPFEKLKSEHRDSIIMIATKSYQGEIRKQLKESGFRDSHVLSSMPLLGKYMDFVFPG